MFKNKEEEILMTNSHAKTQNMTSNLEITIYRRFEKKRNKDKLKKRRRNKEQRKN